MLSDLIDVVRKGGSENAYGILVLMMARPLGLLFGFQAFAWAISANVVLRIGIGFAIGLPALVPALARLEALVLQGDVVRLASVTSSEFAFGFAFGLLASLPFLALQYAGAITDAVRGESDGGQPDPGGSGAIQTSSMLYLVIGFGVFFGAGGLWALISIFYRSYAIWPLGAGLPPLNGTAAVLSVALLSDTLLTSIRIAAPLLTVLIGIEIGIAVSARLARRMSLYDLSFAIKNLATVCLLPAIAWVVYSGAGDLVNGSSLAGDFVEAMFAPTGEP